MSYASTDSFSWMNPNLEVRGSRVSGKGIFARNPINKGELLLAWGGKVMPIGDESGDFGVQITRSLVIVSPEPDDVGNFVNHSCEPNAGIRERTLLVAMWAIRSDEEITFDYAMCLRPAPGVKRYEMTCCCGTPTCRGIVTEDDWANPLLQHRYAGYIEKYRQENRSGAPWLSPAI